MYLVADDWTQRTRSFVSSHGWRPWKEVREEIEFICRRFRSTRGGFVYRWDGRGLKCMGGTIQSCLLVKVSSSGESPTSLSHRKGCFARRGGGLDGAERFDLILNGK